MEGRTAAAWLVIAILVSLGLSTALSPASAGAASGERTLTDRPPILIQSNGAFTASNGVVAGNGTPDDPYVIWGWSINTTGTGLAIQVSDTTAYFTLRGVELRGSILLSNVLHAHVENTTVVQGAITVSSSNDVVLRGNSVANGSIAVAPPINGTYPPIRGSHGIVVDSNTIVLSPWAGIDVALDNVTVSRNTVSLARTGIWVSGDNVSVLDNEVRMISDGIEIAEARNTTLRGNYLHAYQSGIFAIFPDNLTMVDNVLSCGDHWLGCPYARSFYSINATNLVAYHNRFLTAYETARDQDGIRSRWDDGYPGGGNYWVNYTGRDNCRGENQTDCSLGDGLGDTPYRIDGGGSVDRYPLQLEPVSDTPTLQTTPPASAAQGQPCTFEARASDSGGVHNVTLYLRDFFTGPFDVVPMTAGPDGVYRATIVPAAGVSWMEYYIVATDEIGNSATFPTPSFGADTQTILVSNPYALIGSIAFFTTLAAVGVALFLMTRPRRPRPPTQAPPAGDRGDAASTAGPGAQPAAPPPSR